MTILVRDKCFGELMFLSHAICMPINILLFVHVTGPCSLSGLSYFRVCGESWIMHVQFLPNIEFGVGRFHMVSFSIGINHVNHVQV